MSISLLLTIPYLICIKRNNSQITLQFPGDGNIHINVTVPEYSKEATAMLEPFIFEEVSKLKGSISAEHGVGFRKPHFIHYSKDEGAIGLMRDLKQLMDPRGILNPYKVLPDP